MDNVNDVWQGLVQDFPFLERTITGSARDLGPYERPANTTAIKSVSFSPALATEYYNVAGQKVGSNARGMVIVRQRMADGTTLTRKIMK